MPTTLPVIPNKEAPKKDSSGLRYPLEIIEDCTDWFGIQIFEYDPANNPDAKEGDPEGALLVSGYKGTVKKSIILPMPSNIQDGNSVSYSDDSLNSVAAAGLGAVTDFMGIDLFDLAKTGNLAASNAGKKLESIGLKNATDLLKKSLAADAVNIFGGNVSLESILARESGQILNPNMELLFNGVTLRTFRFSFKMTPRDNKESDSVKNIIRTLKKHMAARGGGTFLETPHVFNLSYNKGNIPHPFLHKFKPCFLKDMSVNYTGENVYTTYSDGTPVSMTMDLTFQEMFPIYEKDYDAFSNDASSDYRGVGY